MEFIGEDGWAAPLLKNAVDEIGIDSLNNLYLESVRIMREMYRKCRLVHAGNYFVFLRRVIGYEKVKSFGKMISLLI